MTYASDAGGSIWIQHLSPRTDTGGSRYDQVMDARSARGPRITGLADRHARRAKQSIHIIPLDATSALSVVDATGAACRAIDAFRNSCVDVLIGVALASFDYPPF